MPEWEYLGKALDEAQGDRGSLAFVTGEAGIGKSRLLAELCEVARQRGFRVLSGRAVDTGTPVTFRPLFEALSGWFRHGGPPQEPHLDVIRAALAQLVPEWRRPGETPYRASPVELGEALLRLLTHIAAGHGCVLVLEDLHWADLDTVAVLEYLGDNLAAAPVLCLATLRSESATPALRVARALAARRSGAILELCRLSSAELVRMTQLCLHTEVLPDGVDEIVRRFSDGLPFLVEELLASVAAAGSVPFGDAPARDGVAVPAASPT
jgi:predicted ATPase